MVHNLFSFHIKKTYQYIFSFKKQASQLINILRTKKKQILLLVSAQIMQIWPATYLFNFHLQCPPGEVEFGLAQVDLQHALPLTQDILQLQQGYTTIRDPNNISQCIQNIRHTGHSAPDISYPDTSSGKMRPLDQCCGSKYIGSPSVVSLPPPVVSLPPSVVSLPPSVVSLPPLGTHLVLQ